MTNTKCPYCGAEMKAGYIQCRDGVIWAEKKRPVAALPSLDSSSITLAKDGAGPFSGAAAEAYCCPACKKIIIDYSESR